MTQESKELITLLIKRRKAELRNSIYQEETKKFNVMKNPKNYNHPADEITWSNQRIKNFTERITQLNKAQEEIENEIRY